jgi:hypothetical protein
VGTNKKGEAIKPLPLALDVTFDCFPAVVDVPLYGSFVYMHLVGNLSVGHSVDHATLQSFTMPRVVAPFVNAVRNFGVGRHRITP